MHSTQLLAQLALWTSSAHAFYPWPSSAGWDTKRKVESRREVEGNNGDMTFPIKQRTSQSSSPPSVRAAREAKRLAKKYDLRAGLQPNEERLSRRENNYSILDAKDPGEKLTEGVDQDGTDYSYFVEVQFGSQKTGLHMLIDTGAGSTWVMGSDCDTEACSLHDAFNPDESDTFTDKGESFAVSYGSGHVNGTRGEDTIGLAGMSFNYEFGIANDTSDDFVHFAFDGILGLAMNKGFSQNFLQAMSDAGEVDANIFGVALSRAADGTNDGEIRFGSANKDKYEGDITYTDCTASDDSWAIKLDDASYDGKSAGVGDVLAYIDTGTTFIFGPKDLVKNLHSVIPGSQSSDGTTYKVPCDSTATLLFTFSGKDYELSSSDWISAPGDDGTCTSNIYGQEVVEGSWLMGATFIKNVYAVFDKDKKRIGFAKHVADKSTESAETTSVADSTSASATATSIIEATTSANSTTKPTLGIGHESSEPAPTETAAKAEETDESDASAIVSASLGLTFTVCIATVFAVVA